MLNPGFSDEHNDNDHHFSDTRYLMDRFHGCVVTPKYEEYKVNPHMRQYARPFVDASEEGNIGRFFNHSCSPNIMIQNVFTDHQERVIFQKKLVLWASRRDFKTFIKASEDIEY